MKEAEKHDSTIALINRLSKSEKATITKKIALSKGNKSHLQLLEIILKSTSDDDDLIKQKFEKLKLPAPYVLVKSQLQDLILKYLVDLDAPKNIEKQLFDKLQSVEVLVRKALHKQAIKILKSIIKEAEKYEFYYIHAKAIDLLININLKFEPFSKLNTDMEQLKESNKKYVDYINLLDIRIKVNEAYFQKIDTEKSIEKYKALEKQIEGLNVDGIKVNCLLFHIRGFIAMVHDEDLKKSSEIYSELVNYINQYPDFLKYNFELYISALHNLAYCYSEGAGFEKEFNSVMEKIISYKSINEYDNAQIIERYVLNMQTSLLKRKKNIELIELIELYENKIKMYAQLMQPGLHLVILTNNTIIYFIDGNWKNALKWNNMVINQKFHLYFHVQCFNKVINLFIHFEMGNIDLLESLLPNALRFLVTYNHYKGIFKLAYHFFTELIKDYSKENEQLQRSNLIAAIKAIPDSKNEHFYEFEELILNWAAKQR